MARAVHRRRARAGAPRHRGRCPTCRARPRWPRRSTPSHCDSVLDRYFDELGAVLESHGGRIEKRIGDMMVTVFGLPERPTRRRPARPARRRRDASRRLAVLNTRSKPPGACVSPTAPVSPPARSCTPSAGGAHRVLAGEALEVASALEPLAPPLEVLVSQRRQPLIDGWLAQLRTGPAAHRHGAGDVITAHQDCRRSTPATPMPPPPSKEAMCGSCGTPTRGPTTPGAPSAAATGCSRAAEQPYTSTHRHHRVRRPRAAAPGDRRRRIGRNGPRMHPRSSRARDALERPRRHRRELHRRRGDGRSTGSTDVTRTTRGAPRAPRSTCTSD